jgi:hypothetical protein
MTVHAAGGYDTGWCEAPAIRRAPVPRRRPDLWVFQGSCRRWRLLLPTTPGAVRSRWPFVCEELVPVGWRSAADLALPNLGTAISRGRTMRGSTRVPEIARSSAHRTIALIAPGQPVTEPCRALAVNRRSATDSGGLRGGTDCEKLLNSALAVRCFAVHHGRPLPRHGAEEAEGGRGEAGTRGTDMTRARLHHPRGHREVTGEEPRS